MRQRTTVMGLTIVLLLTLLSVSVIGEAAPPQQQPPQTLAIGWIEGRGADGERGAALAIEQINSAGGITGPDGTVYRLELVQPQRPLIVAEDLPIVLGNLLSQQVVAIIGPVKNELTLPNVSTLANSGVPILTLSTSDTITDVDPSDNVIRVRAAERYYSRALGDVLLRERGYDRIALIQTDIESTEALVLFEQVMSAADVEPILKIQRTDASTLQEDASALAQAQPQAVVMWGPPEDAAVLLQTLRAASFSGDFVYRDALEGVSSGAISQRLGAGMIGATSWAYTTPNAVSETFLLDYVTTFNRIPSPIEASAYDAVWIVRRYIEVAGPDVSDLYDSLSQSDPIYTVQGQLDPAAYGNGDVARHVAAYRLNETGGPVVIARYANDVRLPDDDLLPQEPRIVALIGTITMTPTPSYTPTQTLTPSATFTPTNTTTPTPTPDGARVVATLNQVNLRAGPSTDFDIVGQMVAGDEYLVLAANADYSWYVINYQGRNVWVAASVVDLIDPGALLTRLPIVSADTIQTPGVLVPPVAAGGDGADLVIDSVLLNPASPLPGQSFTVTVLVRNQGTAAAGPFSISTTFQPGGVPVSGTSNGIPGGSAAGVTFTTSVNGSGAFTINMVVDPDNRVVETNEGNNIYAFSYTIDAPVIAQIEGLTIAPNVPLPITGTTPDILWDTANLLGQGNARFGIIPGLTYAGATSALIDPNLVTLTSLNSSQLVEGAVYGLITNEGQRGVLRIDTIVGGSLLISYRIFGG